jgi:hypothetical protein
MSLSSWWKSLFKKEPVRTEREHPMPLRPMPEAEQEFFRTPVRGTVPRPSRSSYLDRQGYAQPRIPARPYRDYDDGFRADYQARRADQAQLQADLAGAEAALLRDELDEARRREDRAEAEAEAAREHSRLSHELDHHYEGVSQPVDDRPIMPSGALDPTYTANPPQDPTPAPEPPKTDEQFYGRDDDFYSRTSAPPEPTPAYEPPAQETYSAPDPAPSSYDQSSSNDDY